MSLVDAPVMAKEEGAAGVGVGAWGYWWGLLAGILAVKGVVLAVDHLPMFFLGDSLSYVKTATSEFVPRDRSFFYGWLIRYLGVWTGSLTVLVAGQVLASAGCAMLCAVILRNYFGVSGRLAAVAGMVCAVEPLQLLYERYVMTEAFSLLAFAMMTAVALSYLKRPGWRGIAMMQMAAVVVVSLRVSYLPVVQAATVLVPMLGVMVMAKGAEGKWRRMGMHVGLSVILFVGMQGIYKGVYAGLMQRELPGAQPAYYYENGFHLLCFVAPLVTVEDFPDRAKGEEVFGALAFDLGDHRNRDKHRWHTGGLVENVKAAYDDPLEANRVAEIAAWNAVRRNPVGELKLAGLGFADYWNVGRLKAGLVTDQGGDRKLPAELRGLLEVYFGLDGEGLPQRVTVTNRYFFGVWWWYLALLLLPVPAGVMVVVVGRERRAGALLIWVFVVLQIAIIAAFSISPTVRFLHSVAWMGVIVGGVLVGKVRGSGSKEGLRGEV